MEDELLLLHGINPVCGCEYEKPKRKGGISMAGPLGRKCVRWHNVYSPATGGMVRRCTSYGGRSMGELADLGQVGTTLKASVDAVKDVAVAALIGVGGAVGSYKIVEFLGPYVGIKDELTGKANMESYEADLAIGLLALGGGIIFTRFVMPNKPEIGTNIAIGGLVLMGIRLLLRMTGKQVALVEIPKTSIAGLSLIETETPGPFVPQYERESPIKSISGIQTERGTGFRPQLSAILQ